MDEFVRVGEQLRNEVVLVVVFEVVDFLEHFVVGVRGGFDVGDEALVGQVLLPVLLEVVHLLVEHGLLLHQSVGNLRWRLRVPLASGGGR